MKKKEREEQKPVQMQYAYRGTGGSTIKALRWLGVQALALPS